MGAAGASLAALLVIGGGPPDLGGMSMPSVGAPSIELKNPNVGKKVKAAPAKSAVDPTGYSFGSETSKKARKSAEDKKAAALAAKEVSCYTSCRSME